MINSFTLEGHWRVKCYAPVEILDNKILNELKKFGNLVKGNLAPVSLIARAGLLHLFQPKLKWEEAYHNLVTDEGLEENLDKFFKGSAYTAQHYIGLTQTTPSPAASDVMNNHAGWNEFVTYDETVRQAYVPGAVAAKSITNASNKAVFTISSDAQTVGGAFLTTSSTRGGTTGLLISVGAFPTGDKSADTGDTIHVTAQYTAADA